MTPSVLAHLAMNAPLSEREPGMSADNTPLPWRVFVQEIADREEAKRELCRMVDGTPEFAPVLVYVTDVDWTLAPAITGCGKRSAANAALIVRAVNSIDAVEAERDQLREAMKGATVIANQSGSLLRERDAKIEALVKALEKLRNRFHRCVMTAGNPGDVANHACEEVDALIAAAKGPSS